MRGFLPASRDESHSFLLDLHRYHPGERVRGPHYSPEEGEIQAATGPLLVGGEDGNTVFPVLLTFLSCLVALFLDLSLEKVGFCWDLK